ncbi:MAG: RHS repeat-associated core domain-containing protein [Ignavibacteriales bacterium]|nr:RHS repeat-associated core domain-containing protein [Ignavibacteriales bacterium]
MIVNYWYDNNENRFRKQEGALDEVYVLGVNGETEAVFNASGVVKFFNINSGSEIIGRFIPGAPTDLYFSNTTLSGTYEAANSITVENNVTVIGPTILKAGNTINLKPGFTAPGGIDFTAKIGTVTNTPKRFYYLKDHLGSIRVVVNETGEIVSSNDYYPFGMILNGRSTNSAYTNAKYKFTSKERDVETGYDYFGARYYDSRIGRWLQVDQLFEKHPDFSPYNYVLNNPLKLIDPDGKQVSPWSLGMPMTLPRSLEELKIRTIAFFGMMAVSAAVYYTPEVVAGVAGWWMRNPVRANELATGLMENISNAPTGVGTGIHIGKADFAVIGPGRPIGGGESWFKMAERVGASYFRIGEKEAAKLGEKAVLKANFEFLDWGAKQGMEFRLSTSLENISKKSFTHQEIQYLIEKYGYKWNEDKSALIAQ